MLELIFKLQNLALIANSLIYLALNDIEFICVFVDSGDPLANVLDFKKNFESEYSLEHPTFYQGLYSQVNCLS